MPKNKGKGGKNRRRGKNESDGARREMVYKTEGQVYAQVIKMHGGGLIKLQCFDGITRDAHICGKLRKKVWIVVGDIVLASLRPFQDSRADAIRKYLPDEILLLKGALEIPGSVKINEAEKTVEDDHHVEFRVADSHSDSADLDDI